MRTSYRSWAIVVAALIAVMIIAVVAAFRQWSIDQAIDIPLYGYAALVLGLLFSVLVAVGLIALMFYSSRYGYDDPPKQLEDDDASKNDDADETSA